MCPFVTIVCTITRPAMIQCSATCRSEYLLGAIYVVSLPLDEGLKPGLALAVASHAAMQTRASSLYQARKRQFLRAADVLSLVSALRKATLSAIPTRPVHCTNCPDGFSFPLASNSHGSPAL